MSSNSISSLVHGIRADSTRWVDCWNFALQGTRTAVEITASVSGTPSLRDAPIEVLREHPESFPATFLSPFASLVFQGAMLRAGLKVGFGVPPFETHWLDQEGEDRTLSNSERELLFEEVRRAVAPDAPSRLTCIWAAENTVSGRNYVEQIMLKNSFVVEVDIVDAVRLSRCDAHWLEQWRSLGTEAAAGYWRGDPMDDDPLWEYLIEGTVKASDPDDVARVKAWAWSNIPPDIRGNSATT